MGSDSDLPVLQEAAQLCEEFGVPYEITIVSAHRTPQRLYGYAENAYSRGIKVIIAGAGGSAHLPGMVASLTHIPVIGVPVHSKHLSGIDSLYSIVQMPPGVPVATVAINGARNAALLAIQILALNDADLSEKMILFKNKLQTEVEGKASQLELHGFKAYLGKD